MGPYSYGQGKTIDYVKTVKYSSVDYGNKDARKYISEITIDRHDPFGAHYTKIIEFDTNETVASYLLASYKDEGYESIEISWRKFDNELEVHHTFSDTTHQKSYELRYITNNNGIDDNCVLNVNQLDQLYTDIQLKPNEVKSYYLDWIIKDFGKLDSFYAIPFPDMNQFIKLRNRNELFAENNTENSKIWESYYVDSVFINGNLDRIDTISKEKVIRYYKSENGITEYKRDYYLGSWHTFEGYVYDSLKNTTVQLLYKTDAENDTIYRISIGTKIENNTMVSDYKILGNHPDERNFYYGSYYPKEPIFKERTIQVIRDSTGFMIRGDAKGLTVDGANVKSAFYTLKPDKDYKNYTIWETKAPSQLSENFNNRSYRYDYSLISMLPNIDLKPLMKFQYITPFATVGSIHVTDYTPHPKFKSEEHKSSLKNRSYKPEYKYETKRIEQNKKLNYEKWKREEYEGEYTIYEIYFQ